MHISRIDPGSDRILADVLLEVQRASYLREAELIADDRIPALQETVDDLQAANLRWLAARVAHELVGAAAWSESERSVELERLVVSPAVHRQGVGSALVREVIKHAGKRRVELATGRDNFPARRLYERLGFIKGADSEVVAGLWVTTYQYGIENPDTDSEAGSEQRKVRADQDARAGERVAAEGQ